MRRQGLAAWARLAAGVAVLLLGAGCGSGGPAPLSGPVTAAPPGTSQPGASGTAPSPTPVQPGPVPQPVHIVVVVMENHSYGEIIGNPAAPYINELAARGALFTHSQAITHPSQPNYLAMFSGSTQGVTDDSCPYRLTAPNLAADLIRAGRSFAGYAENLPAAGSQACSAGDYARKHVPWADFSTVPGSVSRPFSGFAPAGFADLPTVSFVIPNLCHDMHDCSVSTGDAWLRAHIGGYADWAMNHDSLLILTWDEDDGSQGNHIATIFTGQAVRPGRYPEPITDYTVLATIEAAYGLPRDGHAAVVAPVTDIWTR